MYLKDVRLQTEYVADAIEMRVYDGWRPRERDTVWRVRTLDFVQPENAGDPRVGKPTPATSSGRARGRLIEVEVLDVPARRSSRWGKLGRAQPGDRCLVEAACLGCPWDEYVERLSTFDALARIDGRQKADLGQACEEICAFLRERGVLIGEGRLQGLPGSSHSKRFSTSMRIAPDQLALVLEVLGVDELKVATAVMRENGEPPAGVQ